MKKHKEQTNVPALRFPEFRGSGKWVGYILEDTGVISTGKTPSTKNTANWGGDILFITPTDISLDSKYQNNTERTVFPMKGVNILDSGSIVYTCIASIGKMAMTTKPSTTNQQINSVTVKQGFNNNFVFYYLLRKTPLIKQLPASSTLPIINKKEFSKIKISIPSTYSEQQKIADCLSSLDELITAESEQLIALKAHKTGLMQQLFPSEGETTPKRRFPEFQNDGKWEEKALNDIAMDGFKNGVFNNPDNVGSGYKIINVKDMYEGDQINLEKLTLLELSEDEFKKNKVNYGDIFFTRSSLVAEGIAWSNVFLSEDDNVTYDGHLIKMTLDTEIYNPVFVLKILKTEKVRLQLVSRGKTATMTTIGQKDVASVKVSLPKKEEQQKIADCLSSLDTLITAQAEKIEQLKQHKKGLMQQLFPSLDEVGA